MTTSPRFERDLPALLEDAYLAGLPDYRDDLVRRIAATRQRPAWTIPERWLRMEITTARVPVAATPWRRLAVAGLVIALLIGAVLGYVGSRPRLPQPFGLAANGMLVYVRDGDLFRRASLTGPESPFVIGLADDRDAVASPDGLTIAFVRSVEGHDVVMLATADGRSVRALHDAGSTVGSFAWSPDSTRIAVIGADGGASGLSIVPLDGGPVTGIDFEGVPNQAVWRPTSSQELLVRVAERLGRVRLYLVASTGEAPRPITPALPAGPWGWGQLDAPVWSPDGQSIAYTALQTIDGDTVVRTRVMRSDGSDDIALAGPVDAATQEGWPAFSPDGSTIVVHRWQWEGDGWLAVYDGPDGDGREIEPRIAANGGNVDLVKTWSPDGTRLLARTSNTEQLFEIDPAAGTARDTGWDVTELPSWQRVAP